MLQMRAVQNALLLKCPPRRRISDVALCHSVKADLRANVPEGATYYKGVAFRLGHLVRLRRNAPSCDDDDDDDDDDGGDDDDGDDDGDDE